VVAQEGSAENSGGHMPAVHNKEKHVPEELE